MLFEDIIVATVYLTANNNVNSYNFGNVSHNKITHRMFRFTFQLYFYINKI